MFMAVSPQAGDVPPAANTVSLRPELAVHGLNDPRRTEVEAFIFSVFAQRYGAKIQHFAPVLVSLQDGGEIVAAAGYRSAAYAPLFLERYLPSPVEALLASEARAHRLCRSSVVEVGNLAASRVGEGRRLIALMGPHLAAQGFQWVVCTITAELRHLFVRLGVTPLALGTADPAALGPDAARWGTYYDHRPVVLAGHLGQALRHLALRAGDAKAAP
ncbi:thermostable hemolysin [Ramlibacter sp. H39-3-26]|uniref:thermostable hemolysin n=1 Tax=Curvibacter soli TaxID=3031331 RepID=UPI0023DC5922|nr:thermostable hemolysin [Ramlibacter sp. H39-3-26]MDF1485428.1 thermostable hemolysin [Ramlibacter sp. H39-3-26]